MLNSALAQSRHRRGLAGEASEAGPRGALDAESQGWLTRLQPDSPDRHVAVAELRELLLGAARYELSRRAGHLRGGDRADLADQSANDALLAVLRKVDGFRGDSRFTTWAYKFALYEAAVAVRRRSWQGRELLLDEPEEWTRIADPGSSAHHAAESAEMLSALHEEIAASLTPHQREVLVAITLNEVPIDVLAERLNSTRGALYKTLHDARHKLRGALRARGFDVADARGGNRP